MNGTGSSAVFSKQSIRIVLIIPIFAQQMPPLHNRARNSSGTVKLHGKLMLCKQVAHAYENIGQWETILMLKNTLPMFFILLLTACSGNAQLSRPQDGYQAIKFNKTVEIQTLAIMTNYVIPAGTILVGDHLLSDSITGYCGAAAYGPDMVYKCFALEDNKIESFGHLGIVNGSAQLNQGDVTLFRE